MSEEQLPMFITYHKLRDEYEAITLKQAQLQAKAQTIQTTIGTHKLQTFWLQRDENRLKKQRRTQEITALETEKGSLEMNLHNASIQLAPLFHLRPEEIVHFEELLKAYQTTLQTLTEKIWLLKNMIETKKKNLGIGSIAEWWDLFAGKDRSSPTNQIVWTVATVLSGRLSSKALHAWDINAIIEEINQLGIQLNNQSVQFNTFSLLQKPDPNVLKNIRSLEIVEYIDILSDILRTTKDWWSIASLLAQWYTYLSLWTLTKQIDTFQESTAQLLIQIPQINNDINTVKFRHSRLW